MRPSKNKKMDKRRLHAENVQRKKDMKKKRKERDAKYKAWLELPYEEWTDARKAHGKPEKETA